MKKPLVTSAFRYPGAKSIWTDSLHWPLLVSRKQPYTHYVEPFVGGGSTLLAACQMRPDISYFVANDLDWGVYSFWSCIADQKLAEALARRYENTKPTVELHSELRDIRNSPSFDKQPDLVEAAFATLFLNRTSFDGIVTAGPMGGKAQKGATRIDSRYSAQSVAKRIREASELLQGRLIVLNLDFKTLIRQYDHSDIALYLDPPYVQKGQQLYPHALTDADHRRLAEMLKTMQASWLCSYDDCDEVRKLYEGWAYVKHIGVGRGKCQTCGAVVPKKQEILIMRDAPSIPKKHIEKDGLLQRLKKKLWRFIATGSGEFVCPNCGAKGKT